MRSMRFGQLEDGRTAGLYILESPDAIRAAVTDYGAALVSLAVPDRDGEYRDVVLGHDDAAGYEKG
ncbi:MAG: galactose-1-epimerase, partial [Mogibacterium sp.]|nr:galactose-1-epimerase [Mogibacterium sp.]